MIPDIFGNDYCEVCGPIEAAKERAEKNKEWAAYLRKKQARQEALVKAFGPGYFPDETINF
jgi:hypothetical protein